MRYLGIFIEAFPLLQLGYKLRILPGQCCELFQNGGVQESTIHIPLLARDQGARIQIDDGRELAGRVRLAPAAVDQRTQLGRARLSLESVEDLGLEVSKFSRMETKSISSRPSSWISAAKSLIFRLIRSRR